MGKKGSKHCQNIYLIRNLSIENGIINKKKITWKYLFIHSFIHSYIRYFFKNVFIIVSTLETKWIKAVVATTGKRTV